MVTMLKFRETKDADNNVTITVERIGFRRPAYIADDAEVLKAFRAEVNKSADYATFTALLNTVSNATDADKAEKAETKLDAMRKCSFATATGIDTNNRLAKAVSIGLGWRKLSKEEGIPEEFAKVYDLGVAYAKKHLGICTWGADRKADFNAVRDAMVVCFDKLSDGQRKEGFSFKLSAKSVESFIAKLYTELAKTDSGKKGKTPVSGSKFVVLDIRSAFSAYMVCVNGCTGVVLPEGKTVTLKPF